MNILILANELRYVCGVTNHLLYLSAGLSSIPGNEVYIIYGGGNGFDRFDNINVSIVEDKTFLHDNRSSLNYFSAINKLSKFVKQNKIDIIHSHSHYASNIASLALILNNVPKVQTNHGLLNSAGKLRHFKADKFIAINEHIYNYIIENKIAGQDNVELIRCGIFVPDEPAKKDLSRLKVIAASRFEKEKGLDLYINAVSKLSAEAKSKADFLIAGEGTEEAFLKELNTDLNAGVNFLGSIKKMEDVLKNTNIFVYPSRSKSEGFPAVITEAGAYNNLLITSDFNGYDSVLKSEANALVFDTENAEMLRGQLEKAIAEYEKLLPVSAKLYNKVKNLYSLDVMISKHDKLYKKCLEA